MGGKDCFVFDTERRMGLFFGDTERVEWDCFPMRRTDCFFYATERGRGGCFMTQNKGCNCFSMTQKEGGWDFFLWHMEDVG